MNSVDSSTVRMLTGETSLFGTSTPTTEILSGMGAMRTPLAPQRKGDIVLQICDLRELHALTERELIARDRRAAHHIARLGIHAEARERLRQAAGVVA